jgi:hypothetical protein
MGYGHRACFSLSALRRRGAVAACVTGGQQHEDNRLPAITAPVEACVLASVNLFTKLAAFACQVHVVTGLGTRRHYASSIRTLAACGSKPPGLRARGVRFW